MKRLLQLISFKNTFSPQSGFTLIELMLVIAIIATLMGITTMSLTGAQQKSSMNATLGIFISDIRAQQLKAMVGDTEGRATSDTYGISFQSTKYTLFHGTFSASETSNFDINLPPSIQVSSTFPNSQITFLKGSGEVSGFTNGSNTITLTDSADGSVKIITINKYGVVTGVN